MSGKDLVIGFDIGTSSLKLAIWSLKENLLAFELKESTHTARVVSTENSLFSEQNVRVLVQLVANLFDQIPAQVYERVKAIQMCGQMHGNNGIYFYFFKF